MKDDIGNKTLVLMFLIKIAMMLYNTQTTVVFQISSYPAYYAKTGQKYRPSLHNTKTFIPVTAYTPALPINTRKMILLHWKNRSYQTPVLLSVNAAWTIASINLIENYRPDILKPDRKSTRLNSSHTDISRMPSSA